MFGCLLDTRWAGWPTRCSRTGAFASESPPRTPACRPEPSNTGTPRLAPAVRNAWRVAASRSTTVAVDTLSAQRHDAWLVSHSRAARMSPRRQRARDVAERYHDVGLAPCDARDDGPMRNALAIDEMPAAMAAVFPAPPCWGMQFAAPRCLTFTVIAACVSRSAAGAAPRAHRPDRRGGMRWARSELGNCTIRTAAPDSRTCFRHLPSSPAACACRPASK